MSTKIKDKQIEVTADYSAVAEPTESGIKTKDLRGFAAWVARSVRWLKNNYLPLSGGKMTGKLTLTNEYETGAKKVYSLKGVVGILKPYSEWTAEEKSGKFRCIKIVVPVTYHANSTPWFRYNGRVSFVSSYNSYNSFGYYEFRYNIAVNVMDTTVPRIYAYKNNRTVIAAASDEFIPLEPVYNTATGNLELWIISKVPRSNNVAILLNMEDYNKNPANAILPTQMELVDNDGYFPVSSPLVKVPFDLVNMETTTGDYSPLSHHSINFDSAIEPTQAGDTVKKSLGWLLQYYAQATKWARNNILSLVSDKADINHTHSEYSPVGHNHDTQYAARYHAHPSMMAGIECVNGTVHPDGGEMIYYSTDNSNVIMSKEAADKFSLYAYPYWSDIKGKPDAFPPSSHTHAEYAAVNHTHNYAATNHNHSWGDIANVQEVNSVNLLDKPLGAGIMFLNWAKRGGAGFLQAQAIKELRINNATGTHNYAALRALAFNDSRQDYEEVLVDRNFDVRQVASFGQTKVLNLKIRANNGMSYASMTHVEAPSGKICMADFAFPLDLERNTIVLLSIFEGNVEGVVNIGGVSYENTIASGDTEFPFSTPSGSHTTIGYFDMKVVGGRKFMVGHKIIH